MELIPNLQIQRIIQHKQQLSKVIVMTQQHQMIQLQMIQLQMIQLQLKNLHKTQKKMKTPLQQKMDLSTY